MSLEETMEKARIAAAEKKQQKEQEETAATQSGLTGEIDTYKQILEQITETEEQLKTAQENREKEIEQLQDIREQIKPSTEELSKYPKSKKEAKNMLAESGLTDEEIDPILAEIKQKQQAIIQQKLELRKQRKASKNNIAENDGVIDSLTDEAADLKQQASLSPEAQAKLEQDTVQSKLEKEKIEQKQKRQKEVEDLEKQFAILQQRSEAVKQTFQEAKSSIILLEQFVDLSGKYEAAEGDRSRLAMEVDSQEMALTKLQNQLKELPKGFFGGVKDKSLQQQLETQISNIIRSLEQSKPRLGLLTKETDEARKRAGDVSYGENRRRLTAARESLPDKENEVYKVQKELNDMQERLNKLKD